MQYNKDSHINNVDDVIKFFRYIVDERNVNFNPDDMFEDYMSADGTNAFTPEECEIYNRLVEEAFKICDKENVGIYEIPRCGSNTIDAPRDLMKELRNALTEVKEAIAGKRKLQSADSLLDEL